MNVVLAKTETGRALSDAFAVVRDRLPGAGKVAEQRRLAFDAYERAGLPHRRIEEWKYTDLRALVRKALPPAERLPDEAAARAVMDKVDPLRGLDRYRLIIVDGFVMEGLSDFDALAVQRDDVPDAKVITVEAILGVTGCLAKIVEIVGGVS